VGKSVIVHFSNLASLDAVYVPLNSTDQEHPSNLKKRVLYPSVPLACPTTG